TQPASPANATGSDVTGSAEAGTLVRLYTDSSCAGSIAASGSAASFASPGLAVSVPSDATTTFYATARDPAGNVSSCSSGVTYVEDSTAPAAPSPLSVSPASPANDNGPKIPRPAETGPSVHLYADAT